MIMLLEELRMQNTHYRHACMPNNHGALIKLVATSFLSQSVNRCKTKPCRHFENSRQPAISPAMFPLQHAVAFEAASLHSFTSYKHS